MPYREQPLRSWRDVNDEVGRVGGHVGMFGSHAHGESKPQPSAALQERPPPRHRAHRGKLPHAVREPVRTCARHERRSRIFVTKELPAHTTIHWHGVILPNGMDRVGRLMQSHIPVGKTFVYEFVPKRSDAHMYHPHADETVQMAMGMMGLLIIHPRAPKRENPGAPSRDGTGARKPTGH